MSFASLAQHLFWALHTLTNLLKLYVLLSFVEGLMTPLKTAGRQGGSRIHDVRLESQNTQLKWKLED